MHISLDGYTTDSKGTMDWISVDEEMFDYSGERTNQSDTALYGHGTYKIMQSYWPTAADKPNATKHDIEHGAWYKQVNKIVVSGTLKEIDDPKTSIIRRDAVNEIRKLKSAPGKEIIMFGSPTLAQNLIQENLIDDYWLFVNPVLLGNGGTHLFNSLTKVIGLKLALCRTFASGVICLHYETKK